MSLASVAALMDILERLSLLEPGQLHHLRSGAADDPLGLLRHLGQVGWLTPYQVDRLAAGQEAELSLGNYLLLASLGEGGMGAVFQARHRRLGRIVALKVIRPARLANEQAVRRFRREIHAAAQLSHPNIVHAIDADAAGGSHFLVMEYVEGTDLKQLLRQHGRLPTGQARDYIRQAAAGLHYAHERGLVHRDVKPANLLVSTGGVVKVLDFGLARLDDADRDESTTTLTREGAFMGSPDYVAPEQALDVRTADHRADLYSLGCTFYHLLAGRVPFPGGSLLQKVEAHRFGQPTPIRQLCPDVPEAVAAIVERLMAKAPEDRFASAAELLDALADPAPIAYPVAAPRPQADLFDFAADTSATGGDTPDIPRPRRRRRAWPWLAGAALCAAVAVAFVLYPRPKPSDEPPAEGPSMRRELDALTARLRRQPGSREEGERLALDIAAFGQKYPGTEPARILAVARTRLPSPLDRLRAADIQPQARPRYPPPGTVAVFGDQRGRAGRATRNLVVYPNGRLVVSTGLEGSLRVWDTTTLMPHQRVPSPASGAYGATFSADGKQFLVAGVNGHLYLWKVPNNDVLPPPTRLTEEPLAPSLNKVAFDGKRFLFVGTSDGRILRWDWSAATPRPLSALAGPKHFYSLHVDRDGKRLVSAGGDPSLCVWDLTAEPPREVFRDNQAAVAAAFSSDGRWLAVAGSVPTLTLFARGADGSYRRVSASERPTRPATCLAFHPDGKQLLVGHATEVSHWDVTDEGRVKFRDAFVAHNEHIGAITFLPGGRSILTASDDTTIRRWDEVAGKFQSTFGRFGHIGGVWGLAFSPDDRTLASAGYSFDPVRLWDLTAPTPRYEKMPVGSHRTPGVAWSPDGQLLATTNTGLRLWRLADRKEVTAEPIHPQRVRGLAFSPDGSRLLFGVDRKARLYDRAAGRVVAEWPHDSHVQSVAFSADGRLALTGSGERNQEKGLVDCTVRLWDVSTGRLLRRFDGHTWPVHSLAFHPDGRRFCSGGAEGSLRLWDREHPTQPQRHLHQLNDPVEAIVLLPGAKTLWAVGTRAVQEVDVDSGELLRKAPLPDGALSLALAGDGRHLAVGLETGLIYLLRLSEIGRAER